MGGGGGESDSTRGNRADGSERDGMKGRGSVEQLVTRV